MDNTWQVSMEANLIWFGLFLELGFVLLILWLVRPASATGDRFWERFSQLKKDYRQLQQDSQQNRVQLSQECVRLRQELQKQNDQLMQEHLQHQQEWQQRETELNQACAALEQERDRLQQTVEQMTQERDRLQQALEQQQTHTLEQQTRLQEQEQQTAKLIQERADLQHTLQYQAVQLTAQLTEEWRYSTFKQLQPLLVGYPSAQKIAHAKPDLSAKSLIGMFTPLERLLQAWGVEAIAPVWEKVTYDPHLHQPDSPDIQPGEAVYIRFVGYRHGETILCPAKVSRRLPGAKSAT